MANLENVLQAKNDTITDVTAPAIDGYPEGYVDAFELPIALSWITETVQEVSGFSRTSDVQIDVFVESAGQDRFMLIKERCRALRVLFMTEYEITALNMFLQTDPTIQVIPGTVIFGGYRNMILALDETPFHGFSFTLRVVEYLSSGSCS